MDFGTATLQHCNTFALLDTIKFNLKHLYQGIGNIKKPPYSHEQGGS